MDVEEVIRSRRTVKAFAETPVPRETLEELFDLARWAPNHRLTEPWRFRVLGPDTTAGLVRAAGAAGDKLLRAPTLIVATCIPSQLPLHAQEDLEATACAVYALLLGAHNRGLVAYWRTPGVLRTPQGRESVGISDDEIVIGLLNLGYPKEDGELPEPPPRSPLSSFAMFLG